MNVSPFLSPEWFHAASLVERLTGASRPARAPASEAATRRLARWREQPPFDTGALFGQRLELDGLEESQLRELLAEPAEAIGQRLADRPAWLRTLEEAFSRPPLPEPLPLEGTMQGMPTAQFLGPLRPLIDRGRERLRAGMTGLLERFPAAPFELAVAEELLLHALSRLLVVRSSRTLVLELNVARVRGLLEGETADARFASFIGRLSQPGAMVEFLREYPVLARVLVETVDRWTTFSLELLTHLSEDAPELQALFAGGGELGRLERIEGGAGDSHRGGRTVQMLTFSSGLKLVYKPRSLAVDVHFQELIAWLNARGAQPELRTLKVLDRGHHGWCEFVPQRPCTSREEVRRFYMRQGAWLSLLHALHSMDFHYENVIASGEHPVPVDLETLFHPPVQGVEELPGTQAERAFRRVLVDSLIHVGLLPTRVGNAEPEVELSGMATPAGQLTQQGVPYWEGLGSDSMRLARKRVRLSGAGNQPLVDGKPVAVQDFSGAVVEGFRSMYQLLVRHRDALLAPDGPLERFAQDEMRVLLRPTRAYGMLLQESYHPDLLRDALERDRFFDRLWLAVKHRPDLARFIAAEHAALLGGDVPLFTTRPATRDVWGGPEHFIPQGLRYAGLELSRARIQRMGEEDLAWHEWFIRATLATMGGQAAEGHAAPAQGRARPRPQGEVGRERLLAAAGRIGEHLSRVAIRGQGEVCWLGMRQINDQRWSLTPTVLDLYSGLPGVALFLAWLGRLTRQEQPTALAREAVASALHFLEPERQKIQSTGGFEGWGSVIYGLAHLGHLWGEPELLARAREVVEWLPPLLERDENLDIIGGAAGCIGALLALHRVEPSARVREVAVRAGERLLERSQRMEQGLGWMTRVTSVKPLAGFSHGAAGMAWALLELAEVSGEERFREAARQAIAYERTLFVPEVGNWRDTRPRSAGGEGTPEHFISAWCHGAPGIGLARLAARRHLDDPRLDEEVEVAVRTTLREGFGANHSLCHGDLGNLELLLQASALNPALRPELERVRAEVLASLEEWGPLCAVPEGVETPGLMTGLAGIGYGLLRLAEPEQVPCVLMLAPPGQATGGAGVSARGTGRL